jgi:hypothetical protein
MARTHTHDCATCGKDYSCPGTYSRNYDGFPEAVCSAWHEAHERECGDCRELKSCDECGAKLNGVTAYGLGHYCADCIEEVKLLDDAEIVDALDQVRASMNGHLLPKS